MILTKKCFDELSNKLNNLRYVEQPRASKLIEESRPIGCFEDKPEYFQALEEQSQINKKIVDIQTILTNSVIFTKEMIKPDTVGFGATVTIYNTTTEQEHNYTIVSMYDSDISKGFISIDAPIIKNAIGLHTGDYFDFRDDEYEITNISYSCQLF
jgi:transcription elongation GreA/GreB family factor